MNKIFRVIWSKARNSYVVVSEIAKADGKSASRGYKKLAAAVLASLLLAGAGSSAFAADTPVTYNSSYEKNTRITLAGPTGTGTVIENLADGTVANGSKEAVNGGQLYDLTETVNGYQNQINTINTTVGAHTTLLADQTDKLSKLRSNVDTINTTLSNGILVSLNNASLKKIVAGSNTFDFSNGDNVTLEEESNGNGLKISVNGTGTVASDNTGLISGGTAYSELRPTTDGTYVKASQTTAQNLSGLDKQVVTNTGDISQLKDLSNLSDKGQKFIQTASQNAVKVAAGTNVKVDSTVADDGSKTYTVSAEAKGQVAQGDTGLVSGDAVNTAITNAVNNAKTESTSATDTKLLTKANVAADNIGANLKNTDGFAAATAEEITANEKAWGTAIGTGNIATPSGMLVTDTAVHNELRPTTDGTYVKASQTTAQNLTGLDKQVTTNTGDISKLKDLSNLSDKGQKVIQTASQNAVKVAAGTNVKVDSTVADNGSKTYTVSAEAKGQVAKGDTGLVSGDTVNTAINDAVTKASTAASTATDTKLLKKADVTAGNIGANLKNAAGTDAATAEEITANEKAWGTAIGTGNIATPSGMLVTDTAVHNELRPTTDGTYVKASQTTAQNLTGLDTGLRDLSTTVTSINTSMKDVVMYDGSDHSTVTFGGTSGTLLKNVKGGAITASSMEAVNGSQLYSLNQQITGFAKDIAANTSKLTELSNSVSNANSSATAAVTLASGLDSSKLDPSLGNLNDTGKAVINSAVNEAIQKYFNNNKTSSGVSSSTASTVSTASLAKMAMPVSMLKANMVSLAGVSRAPAAVVQTPENSPVTYNSSYENYSHITLAGPTGTGTVIDNLADGTVANGSKEAVNGGQLYDLRNTVNNYQTQIDTINTTVGAHTALLATQTGKLSSLRSDVDTINTTLSNGILVSLDNGSLKKIAAGSNTFDFATGDNVLLESEGNGNGLKISVKSDGKVEASNKGLVTGDTVYQAIKDIPTTATLAGKADTDLGNLNDAGKAAVKKLAGSAVTITGDSHLIVDSADDSSTGGKKFTVSVKTDGKVAKGNTGLVTGDTVYSYVDSAVKNVTVDTSGLAKSDLSNLTDAGKQAIKEAVSSDLAKKADKSYVDSSLASKADKTYVDTGLSTKANTDGSNINADKFSQAVAVGKVVSGDIRAVSGDTVNTAINNAVSTVTSGLNTKLEAKADKDLSNLSDKGKSAVSTIAQDAVKVVSGKTTTVSSSKSGNTVSYTVEVNDSAIKDAVKPELDKKANTDGSNIDITKFTSKLDTGKVERGNTGLVDGGAVFEAISKVSGGNGLVQSDGETVTVAKDDTATKIDFTDKDGNSRVVSGIVTDETDATSAANVGYVQSNMEQVYHDMSSAYNKLDKNINKAAAGSNALAALHPLDYDPSDKVNFAVGYGHYRGANAAAIGAFYRPNENTMVNIGVSMGNGDPGVNAGVSFKVGPGSAYNGVSKVQMIDTINAQAKEIRAIEAKDAAKDNRISQLEAENQKMKEQINEILQKLGSK